MNEFERYEAEHALAHEAASRAIVRALCKAHNIDYDKILTDSGERARYRALMRERIARKIERAVALQRITARHNRRARS